MLYDVLNGISMLGDRAIITQLTYETNMSYANLKPYIDTLFDTGMIEATRITGDKRVIACYYLTDKGKVFFKKLEAIIEPYNLVRDSLKEIAVKNR